MKKIILYCSAFICFAIYLTSSYAAEMPWLMLLLSGKNNISSPQITVSSVLKPFDANTSDLQGPLSHSAKYGMRPTIIVASNGTELDVLAYNFDLTTMPKIAALLHIAPSSGGYKITQALTEIPILDSIIGLANDSSGNRYYVTGRNESSEITLNYPPKNTYRSDIVRVVKLNAAGNVLFNVDLDTARYAFNNNSEMIINPMVAATSRLNVGGNEIALVHGINTNPDNNGIRHQKALSTRLDATTGAISKVSSIWCSHSFDQRLLYDGTGIIEHHLGDAYPRHIVFAKNHTSYPLLRIKGTLGDNNTYTRLGNIALIENDSTYRYLALFATESTSAIGSTINGPRNLAIVRINGSDSSIDPTLPDTLAVTSAGNSYTNRLKWLTNYSASSNLHAERPKLIGIGGNKYAVLWEEWSSTTSNIFNGVHGMIINDKGEVLTDEKLLTRSHHLHRGDDAFFLNGRAAWMTGNAANKELKIHFVDESLNYEMLTLK